MSLTQLPNITPRFVTVALKLGDVTARFVNVALKLGDVTARFVNVTLKLDDVTAGFVNVAQKLVAVTGRFVSVALKLGDVTPSLLMPHQSLIMSQRGFQCRVRPTCLTHKWNESYLPLLAILRASLHFARYSFPIPMGVGGLIGLDDWLHELSPSQYSPRSMRSNLVDVHKTAQHCYNKAISPPVCY